MALIKCPECGTEVSDKAAACPKCAYPIQQAETQKIVEMAFDAVSGQVFNNKCFVYDMAGNELASCRQGDTISFRCEKPMTVKIKMSDIFTLMNRYAHPQEDKVKELSSEMTKILTQNVEKC